MLAAGAVMAEAAGAEVIDFNMGWPGPREVTGVRCGSALMRDLDQAERLIAATVEATTRPVTLKMRLGWDEASRNAPRAPRPPRRGGGGAGDRRARPHALAISTPASPTGSARWPRSGRRSPCLLIVNGDVVDIVLGAHGADAVIRADWRG